MEKTLRAALEPLYRDLIMSTSSIGGAKAAWSDVCKIAPFTERNASNELYYAQLDAAERIFRAEVETLAPSVVLMLTGDSWAADILNYMNGGSAPKPVETVAWDRYKYAVYKIGGVTYIRSEHPQGKNETAHTERLAALIKKYGKA